MVPMQGNHLLARDRPQPKEEGHSRLLEIALQLNGGGQKCFLNYIGGIKSPLQARIEAQSDHPAQPLPMPGENVAPDLAVPSRKALQQLVGLAGITGLGSLHTY